MTLLPRHATARVIVRYREAPEPGIGSHGVPLPRFYSDSRLLICLKPISTWQRHRGRAMLSVLMLDDALNRCYQR